MLGRCSEFHPYIRIGGGKLYPSTYPSLFSVDTYTSGIVEYLQQKQTRAWFRLTGSLARQRALAKGNKVRRNSQSNTSRNKLSDETSFKDIGIIGSVLIMSKFGQIISTESYPYFFVVNKIRSVTTSISSGIKSIPHWTLLIRDTRIGSKI